MKAIKIITIISVCIATLIARGKDETDGLLTKNVTASELSQLEILKIEIMEYANLGCIKLAEKKQKEFLHEMKKIRKQGIEAIEHKNKNLERDVREELIRRFVHEIGLQAARLDAFILQKAENIHAVECKCSSIILSTKDILQKKKFDKTKIIKTVCQDINFSIKQRKDENLIFYLSNDPEDDFPKIILAYVMRSLFQQNNIQIKILLSFDKKKANIIELNKNNHSQEIEWDKSLDFLESLQKVMINFVGSKSMKLKS